MSVCINRCGNPSANSSGGVLAAIGSSAARIRATGVSVGIAPTPDDPTNVTCGGVSRANFGSKRC